MQPLRQQRRMAVPSASASTLSVLAVALAVLIALSTGTAAASQGGSGRVVVQPTQALAILLGPHAAMSAPDESSAALELVRAKRPITEERTVLPVIGHTSGVDGVGWLQVLLPGRPNGHTGWIKLRATRAALTLALSARSNVLQEFAGGPGQIAVHGLKNVGGVLGSAASHGCVRLANA